ncbi:MFS transporter [Treponema zioleckii]|uniref:MFS transporter n=1 Tax=Treponema zioleckii TaxID=331680 RepID=UPI00168B2403|nr:MFS transporter [Treponema zioleckii]
MSNSIKIKLFFPNYFSFFINGAMVLLVGAILPYLREEANLSYTISGSLLSIFAVGNFLASFVNPGLTKLIGRKCSIITTAILQPVSLIGISMLPPVPILLLLFLTLGISRGCYSIINNAYINEKGDGSAASLNILHMVFAIGAFLAPTLLSIYINLNLTWRDIIYTITVGSVLSILFLCKLDLSGTPKTKTDDSKSILPEQKRFWTMPIFYVSGFILFFYLGLENCVNGWFVSYLKNTGVMSQTYANELVSLTWLAVLVGRLTTAVLSTKIKQKWIILADCIATAIFFILLVSTKNLVVITIAIIGLGFFFAGIYPTGVSNAAVAIKGSDFGTSMFLAISALGGIITPQIVGKVADHIGLTGAISTLLINVVAMIALSLINVRLNKNK